MKKFIILSVFALLSTAAFAQNQGTRYQGEVQAGYAFGMGDYKIDRVSLHMINGIRFNPYLSAGVGIGVDFYTEGGESLISMPLFVNVKGYLPVSQKVSLFASLDLGYSVPLKSYEFSVAKLGMKGFLITPAVGASFKVADHKAINLSLGYDVKTATAEAGSYSETQKCNAIGLKLGFAF